MPGTAVLASRGSRCRQLRELTLDHRHVIRRRAAKQDHRPTPASRGIRRLQADTAMGQMIASGTPASKGSWCIFTASRRLNGTAARLETRWAPCCPAPGIRPHPCRAPATARRNRTPGRARPRPTVGRACRTPGRASRSCLPRELQGRRVEPDAAGRNVAVLNLGGIGLAEGQVDISPQCVTWSCDWPCRQRMPAVPAHGP